MQLFDLHCDTLYRAFTDQKSINEPHYHISVDRGQRYDTWNQIMAIWISDELRGQQAFTFTLQAIKYLKTQLESYPTIHLASTFSALHTANSKQQFMLAIEGGAALAGKLENIQIFSDLGVRFMTLTWNGENEIGDGAGVDSPKGITSFGKRAIPELERRNIVIDLSHASDALFDDVASLAGKPFVATHSNARSVCNHKRNLTDEQFRTIKANKGLVGLNFCKHFLAENSKADLSHLLKHTEHFLALGGEDILCLGSDFDGTDMPKGISGIESMQALYEYYLKHNYTEELVQKIFFKNAQTFCKNFDK